MVCSLSSCLSHAQLTVNLCGRADLSNATLYQNTELQARVVELEAELAAVKMAYTTATDVAALDKKAHNAQLSTLNRQIYAVSCSHVCVHTLLWRHSRVRIYS